MKIKLAVASLLLASLTLTLGAAVPSSATSDPILKAEIEANSYLLAGDEHLTIPSSEETIDLDNNGEEIPVEDLSPRPEGMGPEGVLYEGDEYPTLTIPGEWVDMPELEEGTLASSSGISPYIAAVSCGSRVDWFRLVARNSKVSCYRDKGTKNVTHLKIWSICPGANRGQTLLSYNGHTYLSDVHGPMAPSNYTKCFQFKKSMDYTIKKVYIY